MATKKTEETAIVKQDEVSAIVVPEFLKDFVGQGLEGMTKDDIQMPRLALAQGLSPQLNPDAPEYIEGLKLGDAWNSLTQQVYGRGPFEVAIVRRDAPRWIEFFPREDGGGVKDLHVPANDPRTQFTTGEDGVRKQPLATQFYDYIVVFLETREVISLSFKSTGLKVARQLNSLLKLRQSLPLFLTKFNLRSVMTKNSKGSFAIFQFSVGGVVKDEETLKFLASTFTALKDKPVEFDREPGSDDGDDAGDAGGM